MVARKHIFAFVATILALLPHAAIAQQAQQAPTTYSDFTLTQADLAAFNSDTYRSCRTAAAVASEPMFGQVECDLVRFGLLNTQLTATLEAKSPPNGTPAHEQFWSENAQWKRKRHKACEAKFASLGDGTIEYTLAFSPCFAEEVFRRIKWLEGSR
jgi:hypothetical protein